MNRIEAEYSLMMGFFAGASSMTAIFTIYVGFYGLTVVFCVASVLLVHLHEKKVLTDG